MDEDNYLNSQLYNQRFSQETVQFAYDYDNVGRIIRITTKEEGKPDRENTFTYIENKVKIGLADQDNGGVIPIEAELNAQGNFLGVGEYNEKQQLRNYNKDFFTWTDDNLTKINRTITYNNGETSAIETQLTYYSQENKNRFHLYNFEGDLVGSYMQYFDFQVGFMEGLSSKNLLKQVSLYADGELLNYTTHYSYSFDSEGFVNGIKETRNARAAVGSFGFSVGNEEERWNNLQTLIANIQQGTVKDKSYQFVSDKDNEYIFNIIVPIKVEKDVNGKPINLIVNKVCQHIFTYEVENGVRKYKNLYIRITFNSDLTTSYTLTY